MRLLSRRRPVDSSALYRTRYCMLSWGPLPSYVFLIARETGFAKTCPSLQAPQRERVSLVVRGSVLLQSTGDALSTHASWKGRIKGNNIESVPRLLWLLEPKIVFAHAKVEKASSYSLQYM